MFLSQIKRLLFYRHIFGAGDLLRGAGDYFAYLIPGCNNLVSPLTINLLITSRCNFNCHVCSFHANRNSGLNEITAQDIERFLKPEVKFKPFLFFSGGEPLVRDDIIDILRIAKKHGFKCGINTNAYLLDAKKSEELLSLGLDLLIFSLYGIEAIHDTITGIKGSYAESTRNIAFFCKNKKNNTRVILSSTITKTNVDCLEQIPLIARKLGAEAVKFEHLNFLSNWELEINRAYFNRQDNAVNTLMSDFNESGPFAQVLIEKLKLIRKKYKDFISIKPDLSGCEIRNWYSEEFVSERKCFFLWHSFFVRPDGEAVPCQFLMNYGLGNIKERRINDIFHNNNMLDLRRRLKKRLLPQCRRCCKL